MTDSFRLRLVMTCADNISAVQHEKRVCRVKCTLYTQGQEATKINGTTLTDSRGKNDLRTAWIYPRPSGPTAPSRRGDEPVTITRFHDSFPDPFLAPRPDPINQRPWRITPSESARLLCFANPSRSSGHEFVQRCVLLNSGCLFVSM